MDMPLMAMAIPIAVQSPPNRRSPAGHAHGTGVPGISLRAADTPRSLRFAAEVRGWADRMLRSGEFLTVAGTGPACYYFSDYKTMPVLDVAVSAYTDASTA